MKGNDGSGNTIERDDWQTPQWLFDKLDKQYNFLFDCCATKENTKSQSWSSNFINEITNDTRDSCWMNPPFTLAEEMFEHFFKVISKGVAIYRCDNMEIKIWQNIILKNADWIFIPKGRISYEGKEGTGSRFPSALIGIGVKPPMDLVGFTLLIKRETS